MQRIDIDDVESGSMGDADRRGLSDPLETEDMSINHYALEPGEAFSGGLHTHLDQEEIFYIVSGTATFETKPEPDAESEIAEVGAGEAIRFPAGEYQQGRNESDDDVVALALGAPRDSTEVRVAQPCPECESDVLAFGMGDDGMYLECPDCGTTVEM
ncbi:MULTISPECIES: cupin domain-containing protein [unclassified Haladaptatus]|uniref:cupin domain-containing protein n=1 Tax=unclassified Haladaptatus TaxID=2622732 RepID=UPI00209C14F1|nr:MULTISPECIES: cupin domain-containing protein [unclassified Haladaptatus]MCO8246550.1 cupin domain-containing protein [Haladaptatus sp. AB643]MCO8254788.1 cupin domain-containing protein [Haladaptatus sp. AB618]